MHREESGKALCSLCPSVSVAFHLWSEAPILMYWLRQHCGFSSQSISLVNSWILSPRTVFSFFHCQPDLASKASQAVSLKIV